MLVFWSINMLLKYNILMVRPERLELPTSDFVDQCSNPSELETPLISS